MEFFKQRPQETSQAAKRAMERGEAVPTIQTALNDAEAFPYLLNEIRKLSEQDKQEFLGALQKAEVLLDIDDPTKFSAELTKEIGKSLGASVLGPTLGVAVLWVITGGAISAPILASTFTGITTVFGTRLVLDKLQDAKRREAMHVRVVKLKDALLEK